jgi:hypothetical protein
MTERQFFITYAVCVLVAQVAVSVALRLLGADDETQASVFALFLGAAGLGGGLLLLRYR